MTNTGATRDDKVDTMHWSLGMCHTQIQRCVDYKTHWPRDKMIVIFHKTVSIVISWINIFVVWYKLHKKIFPRFQLVISYSLGSDNGLAPKRRQAIIWTNDNPAYRHIYAPVGFLLVLLANMRRTGLCKLIVSDTNLSLPRRHNEDAGVSNHRIDCSLQRLLRRRSKILFFSNMDAKVTV